MHNDTTLVLAYYAMKLEMKEPRQLERHWKQTHRLLALVFGENIGTWLVQSLI